MLIANKIKKIFLTHPKLVIPTVALVTIMMLGIFEFARATIYMNRVKVYKQTQAVVELSDKVNLLNRSVELASPAALCQVSHKNLLSQFNDAYRTFFADNVQAHQLLDDLYETSKSLPAPPRFWSLMTILPNVQDARSESSDMREARQTIQRLSERDARSEYCVAVSDALTRTYFLQDLQTPQGVSALFVGQIENFQVNVSQAQEMLVQIPFPTMFESEHTELVKLYQQIALNLREDDNNYTAFARRIETDVAQLELVLARLTQKSADLQTIPKQLTIAVDAFK